MQDLGWVLVILAGMILIGMLIETHSRVKRLQETVDTMHGQLAQLMERQSIS